MRNIWPKHPTDAHVALCTSWPERLRGLMGKEGEKPSRYTVLVPCASIHTFGMDACIDVAFVDEGGCVVASYERVPPGSKLSCRGARMTLERKSESSAWFACGDSAFATPCKRLHEGVEP